MAIDYYKEYHRCVIFKKVLLFYLVQKSLEYFQMDGKINLKLYCRVNGHNLHLLISKN